MHVVMLSDFESSNGAAIAASRLAQGLCGAGHQVTRIVDGPDRRPHDWSTCRLTAGYSASFPIRLARRLLPSRALRHSRARTTSEQRRLMRELSQLLAKLRPDVINVHNLLGSLYANWSLNLVKVCCDAAPTAWTLHDMWSFTGRCAYSYDCRKFVTGCDATCPTPKESPALEPKRIAGAWEQRRRLLDAYPNLVAIAPSRWLAREAEVGSWANHRIEIIPNGLPLDVYRPIDRGLSRRALGIETESPVLLTVATDVLDRRKGGSFLIETLRRVSHRPLMLVTLGNGMLQIQADGICVKSLGYVDHERTKALAYSAADILVHPAPVDNLPNVVVEAIACGTPVVCFPVGGVPEMVRPGKSGWVAEDVSPAALARAIDLALVELSTRDWRSSCRAIAEAEYGIDLQTGHYVELFQSLRTDAGTAKTVH